jgi:hypothetical protein
MAKHVFVVFTNPVEGKDVAYNDWYDNRHLPAWCMDIPRDLSSIYGAATVGVAAKIRDSRTPNFE